MWVLHLWSFNGWQFKEMIQRQQICYMYHYHCNLWKSLSLIDKFGFYSNIQIKWFSAGMALQFPKWIWIWFPIAYLNLSRKLVGFIGVMGRKGYVGWRWVAGYKVLEHDNSELMQGIFTGILTVPYPSLDMLMFAGMDSWPSHKWINACGTSWQL